jgi:AcrR family transcriptional regulator
MSVPTAAPHLLVSSEPDETTARILDAALVCWERFGVAKTTLDDVAREAGCSRATLYRYVASRTTLVTAVVDREVDRLTFEVLAAGEAETELEPAVVAMMLAAGNALEAHPVLRRALEFEPEVVLPALSFEGGDHLYAEAARRFAPAFARFVPPDRAPRAAEWCARVLLAYLHPDRDTAVMTDEDAVRALARRRVIPAIAPRPTITTER